MADEKLSLHIDTDWKRQAQEEKKRLIEQEAKKAQQPPAAAAAPVAPLGMSPTAPSRAAGGARQRTGEMPPANFSTLVQSLLTQALFYLGEMSARGLEPTVNLDMAKHQLDTLAVLENKTRGNLDAEETRLMDTALYESRMRFVNVASQYL